MHLFEEGEDPELSKPVTINLKVQIKRKFNTDKWKKLRFSFFWLLFILCFYNGEQEALQGMGEVKGVEERSLTGTWDVASLQRWKWKTADNLENGEKHRIYLNWFSFYKKQNKNNPFTHFCFLSPSDNKQQRTRDDNFTVTISPKEIRTFFVHFVSRNF